MAALTSSMRRRMVAAFVASRLATAFDEARRRSGPPAPRSLCAAPAYRSVGHRRSAGPEPGRAGIHQVDDVRIKRGLVGERGEQPVQRPGQIGQQAAFDGLRQLDQRSLRR